SATLAASRPRVRAPPAPLKAAPRSGFSRSAGAARCAKTLRRDDDRDRDRDRPRRGVDDRDQRRLPARARRRREAAAALPAAADALGPAPPLQPALADGV